MADNPVSPQSALVEPWDAELSKATEENEEEGMPSDVPSILRRLIADFPRDGQTAAIVAAKQVDADYWNRYLPSDPLLRGEEDKGIGGFLVPLFELLMTLARHIHYEDNRQDASVQLLIELRRLPSKEFTIRGAKHLVYENEPIFGSVCEDSWNGDAPVERPPGGSRVSLESACDQWINLSTFFARCTAAGIFDAYDDSFKYPSVDIRLGLEDPLPDGRLGECRLMVAMQWIRLAGRMIRDDV